MATAEESLGHLAREIADDAARLVRAEIEMAKQEAKAFALRLAAGVVALALAAGSAGFFLVFLLGTIDEAGNAYDNWPMGAAVGCLLVAGILFGIGTMARPLRMPAMALGGISALGFPGFTIFFFVSILAGGQARTGWAITALVFFGAMFAFGVPGALLIWRGIKRGKTIPGSVREDIAWFKQLTKRDAKES